MVVEFSAFMFGSFHFLFFVLVAKLRKTKILRDSLLIIFIFRLARLALQTENIVQKITQPIFVFRNFINQNEK